MLKNVHPVEVLLEEFLDELCVAARKILRNVPGVLVTSSDPLRFGGSLEET